MATLKEYFDSDFPTLLSKSNTSKIEFQHLPPVEIQQKTLLDFFAGAKYIAFYIPDHPKPIEICITILNNLQEILTHDDGMKVAASLPGERQIWSDELQFSGRIFFYIENKISESEFEKLRLEVLARGLAIQHRGTEFTEKRSELEKPLAFISHDSRDKDLIARPLAIKLTTMMCPVWYDEFSLKVGDRLRESIEKGLKETKKCILILSENFLTNNGWTKVEFNSVFTREIIENTDLVLPVWCGVDKQQIYNYSPSLVDKVGLNWELGVDRIAALLRNAIVTESNNL